MKLYAIDGNSQKLDGGAMFGNAPKALWQRWTNPDANNRIDLATRALLIQTDDQKNILFEVGIGAFFEPKLKERYGIVESNHQLLINLKKIGLKHTDIDTVILSHLHFDHVGGLLPEYGDDPIRLLFPNAKYYVGKAHWERAQSPHIREKASFIPLIHELLENSGRLTLVDESTKMKIGIPLKFYFSNGHTSGLMASEIALPSGPLVFISDICPGTPWVHLPITMGYDRYPERIVDEKQTIFESLYKRNGRLFFTHDPKTACAKIVRDEEGKFSAEPVELLP
ncbi:MAG: MBL fold metallo-hydrolase [Chlamydiota bacterium]|nr:MBL fold metallo-hydrolase [Chlamydiota bacterium]